jgi:hypothetical protein
MVCLSFDLVPLLSRRGTSEALDSVSKVAAETIVAEILERTTIYSATTMCDD